MTTKFEELMLDQEFRKLYAIEGLIADTAQMISDLLERRVLKQADLARLLNKTPAFVSQLLNGKANMTVRTLAEVIYALGATVKIDAVDENASAMESEDSPKTHTFRLPETQMGLTKGSIYRFKDFGNRRMDGSEAGSSDSRLSVAA